MPNSNQTKAPLIFAVGGAKGGVGKSMVCSNLAIQYAQEGLSVALLDLDFGAANLHTLFGLSRPPYGWVDYFKDPTQSLRSFLLPTKQENLFLLPAAGFVPEMADLSYEHKVNLIRKMKEIKVDIVFLDLGAGSSKDMVDFFSIADYKLLVTTAEPTALMNNYEFIKNVLYRTLKRLFEAHPTILNYVENFKNHSNATVDHLIQEVSSVDSWQGGLIQELVNELSIYIVFNQIRAIEEAKLSFRLKKVCKKQLSIDLQYPGFVFYNEDVSASVKKMLPISLIHPNCIISRIFRRMAHTLINSARLENKVEKSLLAQAWAYLDHDFRKNRAEEKKRFLKK